MNHANVNNLRMTLDEFKDTMGEAVPPEHLTGVMSALWYARKGDWNRAHDIVQDLQSAAASEVHAFLHREEGDHVNARYWYDRAGVTYPSTLSYEEEWDHLARKNL